MGNTDPNFYEILGVSKSAKPDEIKRAYYKLMRQHHPDVYTKLRAECNGNKDLLELVEEKIKSSEEQSKLINEAYGVLSNAAKRRDYDTQLAGVASKPQGSSRARTASSHAEPPDIRISQNSLDFGTVTKGQTKKLLFTISNIGGPARGYQIGWSGSPAWADADTHEDPTTVFPIKVTVTVSDKASVGNHEDTIVILVDGDVCAQIPVSVTIKSVPKTQTASAPAPTYSAPSPSTVPVAPAKVGSGVVVLVVLVCLIVVGAIIWQSGRQVRITSVTRVLCTDVGYGTNPADIPWEAESPPNNSCLKFSVLNNTDQTIFLVREGNSRYFLYNDENEPMCGNNFAVQAPHTEINYMCRIGNDTNVISLYIESPKHTNYGTISANY